MAFQADARMLEDLRRFKRRLALAPRVRYRHPWAPRLGQALLRLTQLGADSRLRRQGIRVENTKATHDGRSVPVRVLWPAAAARGIALDIHGGGWSDTLVLDGPAMLPGLRLLTPRLDDAARRCATLRCRWRRAGATSQKLN